MTFARAPFTIDRLCGMPALRRLSLGRGRRVSVDVSTGGIWASRGILDSVRLAAARLIVMSWVESFMPVATPGELWALEAAALAIRTHSVEVIRSAFAGLPAAAARLTDPEWELPAGLRAAVGQLDRSSRPQQWDSVLNGIRVVLRSRVPTPAPALFPQLPAPLPGSKSWFGVEWDRVRGYHVDPRELAGCATLDQGRWRVEIPCILGRCHDAVPELAARLVDTDSAAVVEAAVMRRLGDRYVAEGSLSAPMRSRWRAEVTAEAGLPPRGTGELIARQFEQAVYRGLLVARYASVYPSLRGWRDTVWDRAHRQLRLHETVTTCSDLVLPPGPPLNAGLPFLAEEWLDPTRIVR
jgi:hypothetical protein